MSSFHISSVGVNSLFEPGKSDGLSTFNMPFEQLIYPHEKKKYQQFFQILPYIFYIFYLLTIQPISY